MARATTKAGKASLTPTDHFTMIFKLKNLPVRKEEKEEKEVVWHLKKKGGWEKYFQITENDCEKLIETTKDTTNNVNTMAEEFDKIHTKIKFASLGKVKSQKVKTDKVLVDLVKAKRSTND